LQAACAKSHLDIIKFLLDNKADVNRQNSNRLSPLHCAIVNKQFKACELILKYEEVSSQNIESGITMARIATAPEIRVLLEKTLKKRRKVILV
jgi:ankyrin repeat protein